MAEVGIFVGWGQPIPGRERQALKVFNETLEYFGALVQRGEIENFEPVALEPHGGDLDGFMLIRGSREQLARLRASAEFERICNRALAIVQDFGVVSAYLGEGMARLYNGRDAQLDELAPG